MSLLIEQLIAKNTGNKLVYRGKKEEIGKIHSLKASNCRSNSSSCLTEDTRSEVAMEHLHEIEIKTNLLQPNFTKHGKVH